MKVLNPNFEKERLKIENLLNLPLDVNAEEDLIKLNHYSNLQPLCSYINRLIKKDRLDYAK